MRSLSVQVQPERSPGMDMERLAECFQELVGHTDLVRYHAFDNGFDKVTYYNFTFGTERAGELWRLMQASIFQSPEFKEHLARASMAMCSSEHGWDEYVQLHHWDPAVATVSADAL